ncbi:hypothetical protein [Paenibacillus flagellatus]|uniref:Neutral/alkaline non-lysosomal ceramidase N-terminal domain-containing protein n=1 Tax=Paenibacillus flagellatus TaxID=2211139 RepID=A0A2V5KL43_9BACL|nr:hypothetical protein [Paenibacillus flagellatus]PYI55640.1 hypothetical protein DLM86_07890 [Paenibacillus flagellatus]
MESVRIGWSTVSITPDEPVLLAGQFYERVSERVRDPIAATALALESADGSGRAVWVGCDLLHTAPHLLEGVRALVRVAVPELAPEHIVLSATHTHTGPFVGEFAIKPHFAYRIDRPNVMGYADYCRFAVARIAQAVTDSWNSRKAGSIGFGESNASLGHNRMALYANGTARMYGPVDTPDFVGFIGPEDDRVELLFTWDEAGELTGIVVNAACTAQFLEHGRYVSADLYGEVRRLVRNRLGSGVHVLGMVGASGDLAPRDLIRMKRRPAADAEAALRTAARRLAAAIEEALEEAAASREPAPALRHRVKRIELPLRAVSPADGARAAAEWKVFRERMEREADPVGYFRSLGMAGQTEAYERWAIANRYERMSINPFFEVELHALRIGEAAIVTNPFELYAGYGIAIKGRSAARQTFVAQLACGHGGYLPTAEAIAAGGYSTHFFSGAVGAEGGKLLVEHTLAEIGSLWEKDGTA